MEFIGNIGFCNPRLRVKSSVDKPSFALKFEPLRIGALILSPDQTQRPDSGMTFRDKLESDASYDGSKKIKEHGKIN